MKTATQNGLLAAAIVAGLLSLPTVWMTLSNTSIQFTPNVGGQILTRNTDFSNVIIPNVMNTRFEVTGLNGHIRFLVKVPIWLVVVLGMVSCLFLILNNLPMLSFPRGLLWCICVVSFVYTTLPVLIGLTSGRVAPGIGWFLGLFCSAVPFIVLWSPRNFDSSPGMDQANG